MRDTKRLLLVGIGEVLFDVFEDGTETLGGAPLNVAVHAHQLVAALGAGEGVVVSRIGADRAGMRLLDSLRARGLSTTYMQTDPQHATGSVSVSIQNGEPAYQMAQNSAWDYLTPQASLKQLASNCHAVCYGSLAQRSAVSRRTIRDFLETASQSLRLYDANLRQNSVTGEDGYNTEIVETSCQLATMIKVNGPELITICTLLGIGASSEQSRTEALLKRFRTRAVVLTKGKQGTQLFTRDGAVEAAVPPVHPQGVHPVGAGDACSAGILVALTLGWDDRRAVDLANRMGSWVASQLPATPPLPESILNFVRNENISAVGSERK